MNLLIDSLFLRVKSINYYFKNAQFHSDLRRRHSHITWVCISMVAQILALSFGEDRQRKGEGKEGKGGKTHREKDNYDISSINQACKTPNSHQVLSFASEEANHQYRKSNTLVRSLLKILQYASATHAMSQAWPVQESVCLDTWRDPSSALCSLGDLGLAVYLTSLCLFNLQNGEYLLFVCPEPYYSLGKPFFSIQP